MAVRSQFNNRLVPLVGLGSFTGQAELTKLGNALSVAVYADTLTTLTIEQSQNTSNWYIYTQEQIQPNSQKVIQTQTTLEYFRVTIHNESIYPQTYCNMVTSLVQIMTLDALKDSVLMVATDLATGLQHPVNCDASGNLIVAGGGGGDASLWANYPAVDNVNMDGKSIENVSFIGSPVNTDLNIATGSGQIQFQTATNTLYPNTMAYSVLGNLTFSEGEQNINNLLGVTHSQGFTLTQDGGGVITFADGTTMATAGGGGGGGNFSTPSNQDLDMNTHKITGITELGGVGLYTDPIIINNDITFSGDSEFHGNASINNVTRIIGNADNYLTLTNVGEISSYNATTSILMNTENVQIGQNLYFVQDATTQNTAYQNPFQTALDLNGQSVVRTQQIFGDNDIIITAGLTDTSESSTLSLTNNGYADTGTYSELLLKPTGVELKVGDIADEVTYSATFNPAGLFTAPKFKVTEFVYDGGLDMTSSNIINVANIISAPATNININGNDVDSQVLISANTSGIGGTSTLSVAPSGVSLNTLITGTEDTATALFSAQSATFSAPFFEAQGFQPTGAPFQKGFINTPYVNDVETIFFSDLTGQTTAYTGNDVKTITSTDGSVIITTPSANTVNLSVPTPQGITSNTFYVNDNVNNINDVIPLMGSGDIAIMSAGSFGQATDITWNKAQTGLSGSVAPAPLSFLTTANASRFTVTATQVRVANIKFQLPVFLSGNNCQLDNCDFDSALTIGTNVTGYITITNAEFVGTQTITVASTFTNVLYFINCNFLGSTFSLLNPSSSQVIFSNCAGFTTYPANATYVGINTLVAGTAQLSTNTIKSVVTGGNVTYASQINMDGNNIINVNNISGRTGDPPSFTQSFEVATGAGAIQMRGNGITTCGTITQLIQGTTLNSLTSSTAGSRNLWTVSIPPFVSGANATFVFNDLGTLSLKNVTLTTGGVTTYPDSTTQNTAYKNLDVQTITNTDGMLTITQPTTHGVTIQSAMKKGTATLVGGSYVLFDNTVTANCVCVVSYADSSPVGGVLCAKVTAGVGIIFESKLIGDVSPVFYMYFV